VTSAANDPDIWLCAPAWSLAADFDRLAADGKALEQSRAEIRAPTPIHSWLASISYLCAAAKERERANRLSKAEPMPCPVRREAASNQFCRLIAGHSGA